MVLAAAMLFLASVVAMCVGVTGCAPGIPVMQDPPARPRAVAKDQPPANLRDSSPAAPAVRDRTRAADGGVSLEAVLSGEIPVESLPSDVVAKLGVLIGFDADKLEKNVAALSRIEVEKARNDGRVAAERARAEAAADFYATVKRVTGWAIGIIAGLSVLAFIAGMIPGISAVTRADGFKGVAIVGGICLFRYVMLTYGKLAGDIAGWVLIIITVLAAAWAVYAVVTVLWRWRLLKTSETLAAQPAEARAAAALAIVAKGIQDNPVARKLELALQSGAADGGTFDTNASRGIHG